MEHLMAYVVFFVGCLFLLIGFSILVLTWTQVMMRRRDKQLLDAGVDPDVAYREAIVARHKGAGKAHGVIDGATILYLQWSRRMSARYWRHS